MSSLSSADRPWPGAHGAPNSGWQRCLGARAPDARGRGDGRLAELLRRNLDDKQVIDALFLATMTRLPTDAQRRKVLEAIAAEPGLVGVTARFAKARLALRAK